MYYRVVQLITYDYKVLALLVHRENKLALLYSCK